MLPVKIVESIYEWKRQYDAVLLRRVDNKVVVYRAATPYECETYKATAEKDTNVAEDWLLNRCILFYEDTYTDDLPAGAAAEIIEEAVSNSFYTNENAFHEEFASARSFAKTLHGNCIALVAKTFALDPDVVSEMSLKKLVRYVALAEAATGAQITIEQPKQTKPESQRKISELNRELANMGVFDKRGIFNDPEPPDIKIPPEVIERLTKQNKKQQ